MLLLHISCIRKKLLYDLLSTEDMIDTYKCVYVKYKLLFYDTL